MFDRATKPALADRRRFAASGNNTLFLYAWVAFRPLAPAAEGRAHDFDSCRPRRHYRAPRLLERGLSARSSNPPESPLNANHSNEFTANEPPRAPDPSCRRRSATKI